MKLITLTTDFGAGDWFAGTMKGVILSIAPSVVVVNITHAIPRGDIKAGAFALAASSGYFPKGTVHVAVVDPGVGSSRKAIAVQTARGIFVGPDNGVLSLALRNEKVKAAHSLENEKYFLKVRSRTFHGRDIFAPVAAYLSRGVPVRQLGPRVRDIVRLPWPEPKRKPGGIEGEVVYVDAFGNAITNIPNAELEARAGDRALQVKWENKRVAPVADCYQAVAPGKAVAVRGSSGFLEIAINGGSAAAALGLKVESKVTLQIGG